MVYILKIFLTLTDTDIIDGEKFNTDGELFNPSILEQKDASGGDHEIVIKEPIIKSLTFAEKDKGLTFLRNKKNKGLLLLL